MDLQKATAKFKKIFTIVCYGNCRDDCRFDIFHSVYDEVDLCVRKLCQLVHLFE